MCVYNEQMNMYQLGIVGFRKRSLGILLVQLCLTVNQLEHTCYPEESVLVHSSQITTMQPTLVVFSFSSFLWILKVSHEYVTSAKTNLALSTTIWFIYFDTQTRQNWPDATQSEIQLHDVVLK